MGPGDARTPRSTGHGPTCATALAERSSARRSRCSDATTQFIDERHSRYVAEHVPGAPTTSSCPATGRPGSAIRRHGAARDRRLPHRRAPAGSPASGCSRRSLCTDSVGSTERAHDARRRRAARACSQRRRRARSRSESAPSAARVARSLGDGASPRSTARAARSGSRSRIARRRRGCGAAERSARAAHRASRELLARSATVRRQIAVAHRARASPRLAHGRRRCFVEPAPSARSARVGSRSRAARATTSPRRQVERGSSAVDDARRSAVRDNVRVV